MEGVKGLVYFLLFNCVIFAQAPPVTRVQYTPVLTLCRVDNTFLHFNDMKRIYIPKYIYVHTCVWIFYEIYSEKYI